MNKLNLFLRANSLFSGINGLIMLLGHNWLGSIIGISNPCVLPIIGINLIVFSLFVSCVSVRKTSRKKLVQLVSVLDIPWVLGSAIIVLFGLFDLSKRGYWIISVLAICVAILAYKQIQNNKS